jgi:hypothetical protein
MDLLHVKQRFGAVNAGYGHLRPSRSTTVDDSLSSHSRHPSALHRSAAMGQKGERRGWLSNRIFKSVDDIVGHRCYAWNTAIDQPGRSCPSPGGTSSRRSINVRLGISCPSGNPRLSCEGGERLGPPVNGEPPKLKSDRSSRLRRTVVLARRSSRVWSLLPMPPLVSCRDLILASTGKRRPVCGLFELRRVVGYEVRRTVNRSRTLALQRLKAVSLHDERPGTSSQPLGPSSPSQQSNS